jgi:hypothetical protein
MSIPRADSTQLAHRRRRDRRCRFLGRDRQTTCEDWSGASRRSAGPPHEVVALARPGLRGRHRVRRGLGRPSPSRSESGASPGRTTWRALVEPSWPPGRRAFRPAPWDVFPLSGLDVSVSGTACARRRFHDLVPLHFPELVHPPVPTRLHTAKLRMPSALCDVIFANSRFTADVDLHERLAFPRDRIQVAYPGIEPRFPSPKGRGPSLGRTVRSPRWRPSSRERISRRCVRAL